MREETGYSARQWRYLGVMHPCVGYSNERIEISIAQGLQRESAQQLDQGELLDVLEMSLDDSMGAIRNGVISDTKIILALFWAGKVLHFGW